MAIELMNDSSGNVLAIRASGKLTDDDYKDIWATVCHIRLPELPPELQVRNPGSNRGKNRVKTALRRNTSIDKAPDSETSGELQGNRGSGQNSSHADGHFTKAITGTERSVGLPPVRLIAVPIAQD